MHKLIVEMGPQSYPIYIGSSILSEQYILPHIRHNEVMIVTNATVAKLYHAALASLLKTKHCESVLLPDGEAYKDLDHLNLIFDALLKHKFSRHCTLIALGGGVIGDMAGFAAACYQRGVNYIQIPTTLLAQVDSSVGGKTAVNHALGKNMIGAFYQPNAVIIDIDTLATLPDREFAAGLAEVIKYGLIYDADFFEWLEQHSKQIKLRNKETLAKMITRCCQIKAEVVAQDEKDSGLRMILNFGHTFAHAIETSLGHAGLLHGEAVAIGMVLALSLSEKLGMIHHHLIDRTKAWLMEMQLAVSVPKQCSRETLLDAMQRDKKKTGQNLRFILLEGLGKAVIKEDVSLELLAEVLKDNPI